VKRQHPDFMSIFPLTLTLPRQGGGDLLALLQLPHASKRGVVILPIIYYL
jgi:hypothetical protein